MNNHNALLRIKALDESGQAMTEGGA